VLIEWMRQDKWQYDNYSPIELAVLKVAIAAWWEGTGDRSEIEKLLPKLGLLQDSRVRNLVLWVFCQTKEELDQIQMRYARALPRFVVRFVSEKDRDYIFKELEKLSDSEVRANTADARQEWLTKTFQPLPPIKLLPPIKASAADSSEPSYQGHSLSEWTAALKNESSRVAALSALLHCGPEGVRALLRADYGNACPRLDLSGLKEKELEAIVPVLIEALKDKNKLVRRPAPEWIVQLPPVLRKPAIPALIDALNDVDLPTRTWVATALGQIGPDAKDAVPKLVLAMHDQDRDLRRAAMSALGGIGPAAKDAVPLLIDRFQREKDRFERCHIPLILGQIGPVTPEVLPILLTALKDPEFNTRNFAAMALGNMKSKEAASALVGVLKTLNEDQNVLKSAAESLGKLGPNKAAVAVLAKRARDPNEDWQVRGAAMSAMTRVDADLITALAVLRENLADPNALVLIRTAETIGELGGRAQPLIPALGKMLMDARGKREGFVTARLLAVQAFEKIGADEECIKVLETTAKDDPDPMITRVAKETLQKLRK
jgi:HEAT repeat protein